MATIWNFDPNYSLPNVALVSLPKMFQIVATWLQFNTEEYSLIRVILNTELDPVVVVTTYRPIR